MIFSEAQVYGVLTVLRDRGGAPTALFTLDTNTTTSFLSSAAGSGGNGLNIDISAGAGDGAFRGGELRFFAGDGGPTDGLGANVEITAGYGGGANGAGGNIALFGGPGAGGTGDGGSIQLMPGGDGAAQGTVELLPPASGTAPALRFYEDDASGSNYFSLQAAATMAGNNAYTWPNAFPAASGYSLTCTTAGVMSWTNVSGGGGAQIFRANLTEAGSNDFVINTGFGNAANEVVSITVRDNNNEIVVPDSVTFDATLDQVTINLASYRAAGGGTLPAGFRVLAVG